MSSSSSAVILRDIKSAEIWLPSAPSTTRSVRGIQQVSFSPKYISMTISGNREITEQPTRLQSAQGKIINAVMSAEALEWLTGASVSTPSAGRTRMSWGTDSDQIELGLKGVASYVVQDGAVVATEASVEFPRLVVSGWSWSWQSQSYCVWGGDFNALPSSGNLFNIEW